MATFKFPEDAYVEMPSGVVNKRFFGISEDRFGKYSPELLGLGDLSAPYTSMPAVCAFFDLEGFTHFTSQEDATNVLPKFISLFLNWFFISIKRESVHEKTGDGYILWHKFPQMIKFLGDGFMVVWDTAGLTRFEDGNIVASCENICKSYLSDLYKRTSVLMQDVPQKLRCGIAKGSILEIGNHSDFIGPSINLASRLQKLAPFSMAWASDGFDLDEPTTKTVRYKWELVLAPIRGWPRPERVFVPKGEYEALTPDQRRDIPTVR